MSTHEGLLPTPSGTADGTVHARLDSRPTAENVRTEFHAMAACIKLLRAGVVYPGDGTRRPRVTLQQYEAMLAVRTTAEAEGLTVGGLACCLGVKHNTVVMLLNRLCAKQLIARVPCEQDHRRVHLRLTVAGAALLDSLIKKDGEQAAQAVPRIELLLHSPP